MLGNVVRESPWPHMKDLQSKIYRLPTSKFCKNSVLTLWGLVIALTMGNGDLQAGKTHSWEQRYAKWGQASMSIMKSTWLKSLYYPFLDYKKILFGGKGAWTPLQMVFSW